jgi:hypothetical protein
MSEPQHNPDPADLSLFTPEELHLAREVLLARRAGCPVFLPADLVSFHFSESLEWQRTEEGGRGRRVPGTVTVSRDTCSYLPAHGQPGPWFDCPEPPRSEPPPPPPPAPDATIDRSPPD